MPLRENEAGRGGVVSICSREWIIQRDWDSPQGSWRTSFAELSRRRDLTFGYGEMERMCSHYISAQGGKSVLSRLLFPLVFFLFLLALPSSCLLDGSLRLALPRSFPRTISRAVQACRFHRHGVSTFSRITDGQGLKALTTGTPLSFSKDTHSFQSQVTAYTHTHTHF